MKEHDVQEHEPESERAQTRQERRDERREKERRFRADNRRSVRITAILSTKPKRKRRRGANS